MDTTYIERHNVPATILQATGYKGTKFKVAPAESVTIRGCAWDGGSRSYWLAVHLGTGRSHAPDQAYGNMFTGAPSSVEVPIEPGWVVVEHVIFCGKDMGLTIYALAEQLAPLLPDKPNLSLHERAVLIATRGLKNTYGGRTNIRFKAARAAVGLTREEWVAAQQALVARRMLRKNGSITPAGRNAAGTMRIDQLKG